MTELPTKEKLDELEALLAKSTPGAWKTWALDVMADQAGDSDVSKAVFVARGAGPRTFDIDLICAMQQALPSLIAAARELAVGNNRTLLAWLVPEMELARKRAEDWIMSEVGVRASARQKALHDVFVMLTELPKGPTNGR